MRRAEERISRIHTAAAAAASAASVRKSSRDLICPGGRRAIIHARGRYKFCTK